MHQRLVITRAQDPRGPRRDHARSAAKRQPAAARVPQSSTRPSALGSRPTTEGLNHCGYLNWRTNTHITPFPWPAARSGPNAVCIGCLGARPPMRELHAAQVCGGGQGACVPDSIEPRWFPGKAAQGSGHNNSNPLPGHVPLPRRAIGVQEARIASRARGELAPLARWRRQAGGQAGAAGAACATATTTGPQSRLMVSRMTSPTPRNIIMSSPLAITPCSSACGSRLPPRTASTASSSR